MQRPGLAAVLIGAALLLRALVPNGYMIAPTAGSDTLTIAVCSGSGPQQMDISIPGKGGQQREHQAKDGPCAFAGMGALAALGDFPALALPALVPTATPLAANAVAIGHGLAAPPPPQTGPPSHA